MTSTGKYLKIHVKHALDLKDTELLGKMDPFVVFEIGDSKVETVTDKSGGKDPEWNDTVVLPYTGTGIGTSDILKISVMNSKTVLPDRLIGNATLPLDSVRDGPITVPLVGKTGQSAGELVLNISSSGQSDKSGYGTGVAAGTVGTTGRTTEQRHGTTATEAGYFGAEGMGGEKHGTETTGGTAGVATGATRFTKVEDRPVLKERKELVEEHRPVEKAYVVETKAAGERALGVREGEVVDTQERVVEGGHRAGQGVVEGDRAVHGGHAAGRGGH